jgi:hypothetical protein
VAVLVQQLAEVLVVLAVLVAVETAVRVLLVLRAVQTLVVAVVVRLAHLDQTLLVPQAVQVSSYFAGN